MMMMMIGDDALMIIMNDVIDDHHTCQNGKQNDFQISRQETNFQF